MVEKAGSWLIKVEDASLIPNGCEVVADKLVKKLGAGTEYLEITPYLGAGWVLGWKILAV